MKSIYFFLPFILLAVACNSPSESEEHSESTHEHHSQSQEDHQYVTEPIQLIDGQKWTVVPDMMVYIQNMDNAIQSFQGSSTQDYAKLATLLQEQCDLLTSNCTMEGQAHDELHKWLVPYLELVDAFAAATEVPHAEEHLGELKASFATFHQYFK